MKFKPWRKFLKNSPRQQVVEESVKSTLNSSAQQAKERLQIIISHERGQSWRSNLLENLQSELVSVIAKHLRMTPELVEDHVNLEVANNEGHAVLEVNIVLPEAYAKSETTGAACRE